MEKNYSELILYKSYNKNVQKILKEAFLNVKSVTIKTFFTSML